MMGIGWIIGILFVVGIFWLTKGNVIDSKSDSRKVPGALDILNERFARGEISLEEYQEKKKMIA